MKEYLQNIVRALSSILSNQQMDREIVVVLENSLVRISGVVDSLDDTVPADQVADILDQLATLFEQLSKAMQGVFADSKEISEALEKAVSALHK